MRKTYYELLQDPRWQKKRLRVMERSHFQCDNCGDEDETLNVHHGLYIKDNMPWEYDDKVLHCFCRKCHNEWHHEKQRLLEAISTMMPVHITTAVGFVLAMKIDHPDDTIKIDDYAIADGVSCYYQVCVDDVIELARKEKGNLVSGEMLCKLRNRKTKGKK